MKKRIISLLLVLTMLLGMLPINAVAAEEEVVYLSISYDAYYINDKNKVPIVYRAIPLSAIEAIDLTEYGLDNMLYDADGDGEYETTALQMLIYAHEELYGGDWGNVNFDALPGSSYFSGGIFGFTENLVYFQNGDFPIDESQQSDYMTVGATSDRIVLKAGDFIDVASFGCYSFLWDQLGGFHLFADENNNYVHDYSATVGEALTVNLRHSFCDLMFGESWVKEASDFKVYYGKEFGVAEGSVTTNSNGRANITFTSAGTYYVWSEGGRGSDDTHSFCGEYDDYGEFLPCYVSSPAYAKVTVTGGAAPEQPEPDPEPEIDEATLKVIELIAAIDDNVTIDSEEAINAALEAYEKLNEEQQELVSNDLALKDAVAKLTALKKAADDQAAADKVIALINAIDSVISLSSKESIDAARTAYDNLKPDQQKLVTNHEDLSSAEAKLAKLQADKADNEAADAVEAIIAAIDTHITLESESKITEAREAYNALTETQRALVANLGLLIAAEEALADLKPQDVSAVLDATMAKLASTVTEPSFGTNYGEWTVLSLARGNYFAKENKYFSDYYNRILGSVELAVKDANLNGALDKYKSTENSRLIVALSSIGIDATAVGEWNIVDAYSDNGINWISKQGLNGTIWALIALDSGNYETDDEENEEDESIRQQCVDKIIAAQHDDGGWSLVTAKAQPSNVDITGMALTALYPYRDQEAVAAACAKAFTWLSNSQLDNGGFPYGNGETSESCVWAIVAATTWGINPDTDERFIKNGNSAIENLLTYYLEDTAQFEHYRGAGYNAMATDQAAYALVAYDRLVKGENSLFDMSDVEIKKSTQALTRVESIKFNETDLNIKVKEKKDLSVIFTPENSSIKDVTWTTSNEAVASIMNGRVTGQAPGTAEITATSVDGGFTAKCTVNVTAAESGGGTQPKDTITVTMRLIGAELADQDVDLSESPAYLPKYVTWIPTTSYTLEKDPENGVTVYDLWMEATYDWDIESIGAGKNYVETVYAPDSLGGYELSEFTNGNRSGWMYTIDGSHPGFGLREQELHDGDEVIWHYINDYAWEVEDWSSIGGTGWPQLSDDDNNYWNRWLMAPDRVGGKGGGISLSGGAELVKPEEPSTTLTPDVSVNAHGVAKAEVSYSDVAGAVEQTKNDGNTVLEIAPNVNGEATEVQVGFNATALDKIAKTGIDLKISTPVADIRLPNDSLAELADKDGKFSMTAATEKDGSITIDVSVGGKSVDTVAGGIVIDISADNTNSASVIVIVNEDGTETIVKKSLADAEGITALLDGSATIKLIDNKQDFIDTADHWGAGSIDFAASRGLFNGVGGGKFDPDGSMTRAMLATTMFRLEDAVAGGSNSFGDVADDTWYTDAVTWASENKIVEGTGEGFNPDGNITREQMATMLYRYANYLGMDTKVKGDMSKYADSSEISEWADDAMKWAVGVGLINGKGADGLDPQGNATRTEIATIYQRMIALMLK